MTTLRVKQNCMAYNISTQLKYKYKQKLKDISLDSCRRNVVLACLLVLPFQDMLYNHKQVTSVGDNITAP